jgi:hypothetical protein
VICYNSSPSNIQVAVRFVSCKISAKKSLFLYQPEDELLQFFWGFSETTKSSHIAIGTLVFAAFWTIPEAAGPQDEEDSSAGNAFNRFAK